MFTYDKKSIFELKIKKILRTVVVNKFVVDYVVHTCVHIENINQILLLLLSSMFVLLCMYYYYYIYVAI